MIGRGLELSQKQFDALIGDRLDGNGPCEVSRDLPWALLARTATLPGARILMEAAAGGSGLKLTPRDNLTRKAVALVFEGLRWPGVDQDAIRSICKVINEQDFSPAAYLHAVLRISRLLRRERDALKLTTKGRALLAEDQAGALQALLLQSTFNGYNLAYLDGFDIPELFAEQIGLILFLIGETCSDWQTADALMHVASVPIMGPPHKMRWLPYVFAARVLRYLCWFGLLEQIEESSREGPRAPPRFRKTELYDRTLRFTLW